MASLKMTLLLLVVCGIFSSASAGFFGGGRRGRFDDDEFDIGFNNRFDRGFGNRFNRGFGNRFNRGFGGGFGFFGGRGDARADAEADCIGIFCETNTDTSSEVGPFGSSSESRSDARSG